MAENCVHFKEFLSSERSALREALGEHRVTLAEKRGCRVLAKEAEADFIEKEIWDFAKEFRKEYCRKCPDRDACIFQGLKDSKTAKKVSVFVGKTVRSSLRKKRTQLCRK